MYIVCMCKNIYYLHIERERDIHIMYIRVCVCACLCYGKVSLQFCSADRAESWFKTGTQDPKTYALDPS